jgi:hypothetical protein
LQSSIAGCLNQTDLTCNQCNKQSILSDAGDACNCTFKYSISFSNTTDQNDNELMSYHIDNNLVFISDIATYNDPFNCTDLLMLDYIGDDTEFGSALNNEFSSLKCSIFALDSSDESGFLSMLSIYNASMSFDGAFMSGEAGFLFNQSEFNFNCSGNISYEVMMAAPVPDVPSNETVPSNDTVVPSNETIPSDETVPSNDTVVPSNETEPSNETVVIPSDETIPSNETVVPSNETVVPSDETVVPSNETVVPTDEIVVPSNETVVPSDEIVVPSNETVVPSDEIVIPSNETEVPSNETIPSIPPIVGPPTNVTVESINRAIDALFPEMAG